MLCPTRRVINRTVAALAVAGSAALLASCTSSPEPKLGLNSSSTNEYFSEAEYGVKASPRLVSAFRSVMPRGGGRDMVGDPYQVKGKWYKPAEDPNYKKVGAASWYGDAFHGRLTANGEVYDMNRLTAAHPTMPLPSYARVTNLSNGSSVIVRVNDRGPYAAGRIIDLSKRAAELLDYKHSGVAKVKVEYVGRAPLDGQDDNYLVASYQPGKDMNSLPGYGDNVMVAMNGPTPTRTSEGSTAPFPGKLTTVASSPSDADSLVLPATAPIAPSRDSGLVASADFQNSTLLGYAGQRESKAAAIFSKLNPGSPSGSAESGSRDSAAAHSSTGQYVAAATFDSPEKARALSSRLAAFGDADIEADDGWYSVVLRPNGRMAFDDMLREAWANGAPEAIVVRD